MKQFFPHTTCVLYVLAVKTSYFFPIFSSAKGFTCGTTRHDTMKLNKGPCLLSVSFERRQSKRDEYVFSLPHHKTSECFRPRLWRLGNILRTSSATCLNLCGLDKRRKRKRIGFSVSGENRPSAIQTDVQFPSGCHVTPCFGKNH